MKRKVILLLLAVIMIPIISFGYDGRFYSINMPDEYKEHNAEATIDESSIVFRKSNASAEFGLKGDIKIEAVNTSSGKKDVNLILNGYSNKALVNSMNEADDGEYGEIIGAESIKIDGEKAVKSIRREKGKYNISYQVATNTKLITISVVSDSIDNTDNAEYEQIINSLKIKRNLIDYWQKILIGVVVIIILSSIWGKIKGDDNRDILSMKD